MTPRIGGMEPLISEHAPQYRHTIRMQVALVSTFVEPLTHPCCVDAEITEGASATAKT